jgi:multiple sugar transport system permease protein
MKEQDSKSPILRALFYLLVVVILVFNLFPFLYAIVSSFRPNADLFSTDLIPKAFTFAHYDEIFKDPRFVTGLINSIIVVGCTVLISLAAWPPAPGRMGLCVLDAATKVLMNW